MSWNYRIGFKRHKLNIVDDNTHSPLRVDEELQYGIVEAYYNEDGEIQFTSANFQSPYGETQEELIEDLELMLKDAKRAPVIDLDKLWTDIENKGLDLGEINLEDVTDED